MNIAEGSTGQSDAEQVRFLGLSIRSLIETVACQQIIRRRQYLSDTSLLDKAYAQSNDLARRLQAFRRSLTASSKAIQEQAPDYSTDDL